MVCKMTAQTDSSGYEPSKKNNQDGDTRRVFYRSQAAVATPLQVNLNSQLLAVGSNLE